MDRTTVYVGLDGERAYQKRRWGERQPDGTMAEVGHPVTAYLVYMQHYLNEAVAAATTSNGDEAAMEDMRKVVALGVACFEQHGMPFRQLPPGNCVNGVINGRDNKPA